MRAFRCSIPALLVGATLSVYGLAVGAQAPSWAALERTVAEEMAARGIPGAVVVVADERGVRYSRAFGVASAATGETLTTAHLMQIGLDH